MVKMTFSTSAELICQSDAKQYNSDCVRGCADSSSPVGKTRAVLWNWPTARNKPIREGYLFSFSKLFMEIYFKMPPLEGAIQDCPLLNTNDRERAYHDIVANHTADFKWCILVARGR